MEAWQIIIPVVTTILGYFFGKWDTERRRKYELEDREYKRRSEIYDKRIQEARTVINGMDAWLNMVRDFAFSTLYYILFEENKFTGIEVLMKEMETSFGELSKTSTEMKGKKDSFTILNDKELLDSFNEFKAVILPTVEKFFNILDEIKVEGTTDMSTIDDIKALSKIVENASKTITKMKIRLDELALSIQ